MIKVVTYFEYQALKAIGKKVTVLKASDKTATVVIGKWASKSVRQLNIVYNNYLSESVTRWQLIQLVGSVKSNKKLFGNIIISILVLYCGGCELWNILIM